MTDNSKSSPIKSDKLSENTSPLLLKMNKDVYLSRTQYARKLKNIREEVEEFYKKLTKKKETAFIQTFVREFHLI